MADLTFDYTVTYTPNNGGELPTTEQAMTLRDAVALAFTALGDTSIFSATIEYQHSPVLAVSLNGISFFGEGRVSGGQSFRSLVPIGAP